MLIEFHLIQNHAPSNLNRDDTGSPKECVFGGVRRARISSQCLKRSIRRSSLFQEELDGHLGARTRRLPQLVADRLRAEGLPDDVARIVERKVSGFGTRDGKERDASKTTGRYETAQTMFLTEQDVDTVCEVMRKAAAEGKTAAGLEKKPAKELQAEAIQKNFRPISVDVALFGRMTTSEALRDVEASTQVAHALSTHKVDHEFDYFTAVDDLQGTDEAEKEEDAGADMIGDVEFNSACYYKYFSVDVDGLLANLTGVRPFRREVPAEELAQARDLAAKAIGAMLEAAVRVTPTGKQNTFAAHQLPALVMVEARPKRTPVSYANAFVEPARQDSRRDLIRASLEKLKEHVEAIHGAFNLESAPRLMLAPGGNGFSIEGVEPVADLRTLRSRLEEAVGRA
jgi:CRISPR system Cascade subunit CasC